MRKGILFVAISIILFTLVMCGRVNNDSEKNASGVLENEYSVRVVKESIIEQKGPFKKFRGTKLLWNKGTSPIALHGDVIYITVPKQNINVKPLSDRKWILYRKIFGADNWEQIAEGEKYNEREPFPLGMLGSYPVFSINPAFKFKKLRKDGNIAYYTKPALIIIKDGKKEKIIPEWDKDYKFFTHSYRGFAIDGNNGNIFMSQQVPIGDEVYGQAWTVVDSKGKTINNGLFRFPDRGCYPVLSINGNQAYGIFDNDIVEPNEEFRKLKKKITHRNWDYVYQKIYLAYSNDVLNGKFSSVVTLDSCTETAGSMRALDLWNLPNGDVFVLYHKISTQWPFIRDKYFPGKPIVVSLEVAHLRNGKVIGKKTLIKAEDGLKAWKDYKAIDDLSEPDVWTKTPKPNWGRFYSPDGKQLFLIWEQKDFNGKETGNYIKRIYPSMGKSIRIPLKQELTLFSLPSSNNGCSPSNKIVIYGTKSYKEKSPHCAEIELITE